MEINENNLKLSKLKNTDLSEEIESKINEEEEIDIVKKKF